MDWGRNKCQYVRLNIAEKENSMANKNKYSDIIMFRTFPHSMSAMRSVDEYRDDIEDMAEEEVPQDAMPKLRKGKHPVPNNYDDVFAERAVQKYTAKPKGTRHRDRASVRTEMAEREYKEEVELADSE